MINDIYQDGDFMELVIKHIVRDAKVFNLAKSLKITPDDLGGVDVYRAFIQIALDVNEAPINPKLMLIKLKEAITNGKISQGQLEQIQDFHGYIYNDDALNSDYIIEHLPKMLKARRLGAILRGDTKDADSVAASLNSLVFDFKNASSDGEEMSFNPFERPVFSEHKKTFPTGFRDIDSIIKGLGVQEYGIILGYSGGGKTAMAIHSAIEAAKLGYKVMFLSMEEPKEPIFARIYANYFHVSYSDLHQGKAIAQSEVISKWHDMTNDEKEVMANIRVIDLKDRDIKTAKDIANFLDRETEKTGFIPEVLYIDQMDYMEPSKTYDAQWQKYETISFEVEDLSNHLIMGEHKFSVWLLHQATGKMKGHFSNAEISGFKGVIKPADIVVGIGKDSPDAKIANIFSLKSRHTKNFFVPHRANMEFMRFDTADAGGEAREQIELELVPKLTGKKNKKSKQTSFKNIPKKEELLPSPNGKFM
jgi:hypothetical protein